MSETSRRAAMTLAAGAVALACQPASAQAAPPRLRLVLAQVEWAAETSVARNGSFFSTLAGPKDDGFATVLLLPPALTPKVALKAEVLFRRLGAMAKAAGVYLAGAATARSDNGEQTEGFLIGPDGALLLRIPKIMPDALAGFSDRPSALTSPAAFPVARLPFGNVGLLVGEDLFRPSHVRALCFNGAEIILNCATEVAGPALAARRDVNAAISYCNMVYVAVATGSEPSRTGLWDWMGNAVLPDGGRTVATAIDIESLRIARREGIVGVPYASRVLPPMVRDGLYGPTFKGIASGRQSRPVPATRLEWSAEAGRRIAAQAVRQTPNDKLITAYDALLVKSTHRSVADAPNRRAAIAQNIKDFLAMVEPYARRPLSKLVMFGEFAFTAAGYRTMEDALSVTLTWPGPELELLAAFSAKHKVYLAAQQLEHDPKFPGRIFNTAFLFDDAGALISRHRKLQCVDMLGTLPDTTPGSIFDRYVGEYGEASLWQVVDTPLGKLAPMICFENMFPEVAQIYAQKGAEVYLHLTSEGWDAITDTRYAWNAARRQHAMQAAAYFLSVNQGDDPTMRDPYHVIGETQVIDPYGRVTGMLRESRPGVLVARVDLDLLLVARSDTRTNLAIWDEPGVYADAYLKGHGVPNNLWSDVKVSEFPYRDLTIYKEVVARFEARGIYTLPRGAKP